MAASQIRAIAICVFCHRGRVLVSEAHDALKGLRFCRPLGGGIEFGETGAKAVAREILEEIGAEVTNLRYVGTLENIFTYVGAPGHEIVQVYDGELVERSLYERDSIPGVESDGQPFQAVWRALDSFGPELPLFPDGLVELLRARQAGCYLTGPVSSNGPRGEDGVAGRDEIEPDAWLGYHRIFRPPHRRCESRTMT